MNLRYSFCYLSVKTGLVVYNRKFELRGKKERADTVLGKWTGSLNLGLRWHELDGAALSAFDLASSGRPLCSVPHILPKQNPGLYPSLFIVSRKKKGVSFTSSRKVPERGCIYRSWPAMAGKFRGLFEWERKGEGETIKQFTMLFSFSLG